MKQRRVAVLVVALVAAYGCGSSSGGSIEAGTPDDEPGNEGAALDVSEAPGIPGATSVEGNEGTALVVDPVPEGWSFKEEWLHKPLVDSYTIVHVFMGPPGGLRVPGNEDPRYEVTVAATYYPPEKYPELSQDGLDAFLDIEESSIKGTIDVKGLEAIATEEVMEPPDGVDLPPAVTNHLSVTQGDWVFYITGREVDVDVLRQFAEGIAVR